MTKGSNFWVIGGEFGSMNFHKLVEGSAQVQGPFKTRKEAEDAWRVVSEASGTAKGSPFAKRVAVLAAGLETVQDGASRIQTLLDSLHPSHDELETCRTLGAKMRPLMQEVREAADRLESLVDDTHWPLPKYREMLFVK